MGVLGLTFKAETDDIRDSLAIKLVKLLKYNTGNHAAMFTNNDHHDQSAATVT